MFRFLHLARRFFGVVGAAGLRPAEQDAAACLLRPEERRVFWSQPTPDQRHALECAQSVLARHPHRVDLARAALLHDVGKQHAGLGALGRTAATTLAALRLPVAGRFAAYLDHGPLGAAELQAAGAEPLVVGFARHHHAARPAGIPSPDWDALQQADHG